MTAGKTAQISEGVHVMASFILPAYMGGRWGRSSRACRGKPYAFNSSTQGPAKRWLLSFTGAVMLDMVKRWWLTLQYDEAACNTVREIPLVPPTEAQKARMRELIASIAARNIGGGSSN